MKAKNQYIKNFIISSVLFGLAFIVVVAVLFADLRKGLVLGSLAGLLFGTGMTIFAMCISRKMNQVRADIAKEETIMFDGAANHWIGNRSEGGWLFLTEEHLYFVPHKFNASKIRVQISCDDIIKVSKSKKNNSLDVYFGAGQIETFVVNARKSWLLTLDSVINKSYENKMRKIQQGGINE